MKGNYKIKKRGRKARPLPGLSETQRSLVEDNLDLVEYPVYSTSINTNGNMGCYTTNDVRQVAYFAICVAAQDYNPDNPRQASFRTYAQNKIKGYIRHSLRDKSRMITINRNTLKIRKEVKTLLDKGKNFKEVSELLGISIEQVKLCDLSWRESWASFDYTNEDGLSLEPVYIDTLSIDCNQSVYDEIQKLSDREIKELLDFFN